MVSAPTIPLFLSRLHTGLTTEDIALLSNILGSRSDNFLLELSRAMGLRSGLPVQDTLSVIFRVSTVMAAVDLSLLLLEPAFANNSFELVSTESFRSTIRGLEAVLNRLGIEHQEYQG